MLSKKINLVIISILSIFVVLSFSYNVANASISNNETSSLQENIYFRNTFGLETRLDQVKNIISNNPVSKRFGVILTPAEEKN